MQAGGLEIPDEDVVSLMQRSVRPMHHARHTLAAPRARPLILLFRLIRASRMSAADGRRMPAFLALSAM